jgi:tetratricopeptide (TPR) repeat protein
VKHPSRSIPCAAVLVAVLAAAPARGLAEPPADQADALLDEAQRLYTTQADYDGALQKFRGSYELRPSWKALSGMALVYQKQGRYVDAITAYERLLSEFGATLSESQLATVRKRIAELDKRVAVVVVKITQDAALVTIDGQAIGRGPAEVRVRLLPGPHTLVATLERHETITHQLEAQPGHELPIEVELPGERVRVVVEKHPIHYVQRFPTWVPWTTMAAGAAVALVGGGLHLAAASDYRDFDAAVAKAGRVGQPPATVDESAKRAGDRKQVAAISLYAVGGAALATGLVLLFVNRPRALEADAGPSHLVFTGTGVSLALDF